MTSSARHPGCARHARGGNARLRRGGRRPRDRRWGTAPIHGARTFLRAEGGLLDGPPLYPEEAAAAWWRGRPVVEACTVPDTNHYSYCSAPRGGRGRAWLPRPSGVRCSPADRVARWSRSSHHLARQVIASCGVGQSRGCGWSVERRWNERILGFWTTPSRISMASLMVGSWSQAAGPLITVRR
jgi:hypothetical protein